MIGCGCITVETDAVVNCGTNSLMGWRILISMLEPNMISSRTECTVAPVLNAGTLNTFTQMKLKCICIIKDLYHITGSRQAMVRKSLQLMKRALTLRG